MMDGDGINLVVGSSAVTALVGVAIAWIKAKWGQKTKVEPTPLPVETHSREEYVTKRDFDKHVEENTKEHEALYSRLNRNDRETSEIKGMLGTMMADLQLIKNKLLKTRS